MRALRGSAQRQRPAQPAAAGGCNPEAACGGAAGGAPTTTAASRNSGGTTERQRGRDHAHRPSHAQSQARPRRREPPFSKPLFIAFFLIDIKVNKIRVLFILRMNYNSVSKQNILFCCWRLAFWARSGPFRYSGAPKKPQSHVLLYQREARAAWPGVLRAPYGTRHRLAPNPQERRAEPPEKHKQSPMAGQAKSEAELATR